MAGIYIHIPFCRQACTYCNFHFSTLVKNKEALLECIRKEIRMQATFFPVTTDIGTIYFGGGTPSLLDAADINAVLEVIRDTFTVREDAEITLEANPDDLSLAYLSALKTETPVNRLSIGIQSFSEEDLRYMHRAHNATEALQCLLEAQATGFYELSVDLIYGTPGMSNEQWKKNLETVFQLQIPHVSAYALTVEEKTELAHLIKKKKTLPPDDEQTAQQFSILLEEMQRHGYTQYEISNFCREPHFAQHNTNYWKGIPYLGVGPSAHSFDGSKRYWNIANNALYIKKIEQGELPQETELLSTEDRYNEFVMTQLRTMWGVDGAEIQRQFGADFRTHLSFEISPFISNKWVSETDGIYRLTASGKLFCDYITQHLFIAEED